MIVASNANLLGRLPSSGDAENEDDELRRQELLANFYRMTNLTPPNKRETTIRSLSKAPESENVSSTADTKIVKNEEACEEQNKEKEDTEIKTNEMRRQEILANFYKLTNRLPPNKREVFSKNTMSKSSCCSINKLSRGSPADADTGETATAEEKLDNEKYDSVEDTGVMRRRELLANFYKLTTRSPPKTKAAGIITTRTKLHTDCTENKVVSASPGTDTKRVKIALEELQRHRCDKNCNNGSNVFQERGEAKTSHCKSSPLERHEEVQMKSAAMRLRSLDSSETMRIRSLSSSEGIPSNEKSFLRKAHTVDSAQIMSPTFWNEMKKMLKTSISSFNRWTATKQKKESDSSKKSSSALLQSKLARSLGKQIRRKNMDSHSNLLK